MKNHHPSRFFLALPFLCAIALNCTSKYNIVKKRNDSFAQSQLISFASHLKNPAEPSKALFGSNNRTLELQFVKELKNNAEVKNEVTFSFHHHEGDADMGSKAFISADGKPLEISLSGTASNVQSRTSSHKTTSYKHSGGKMQAVETTNVTTHTFKVSKGSLNLTPDVASALQSASIVQVRVYFGADTATFTYEQEPLQAVKRYLANIPDEVE